MALRRLLVLETMVGHGGCRLHCNPSSPLWQSFLQHFFRVSQASYPICFWVNSLIMKFRDKESPRILIRNGKKSEASDVIDMLSLEDDQVSRAETTVCSILPLTEINQKRDCWLNAVNLASCCVDDREGPWKRFAGQFKMAGYFYPRQIAFLPASCFIGVCDEHVPTYRGKPHHLLCVGFDTINTTTYFWW